MTKIFVNGCSHTEGSDLSIPDISDNYPNVIEREFGIPTSSLAHCGSSNERIVRSTIEHITKNPHYTHAFIQWSGGDRFESPANPTHNESIEDNFEGYTQHWPWSQLMPERAEKDVPFRPFYRRFYDSPDRDEVESKIADKMYTQMLSLNAFLESYDIIPVHFTHWPCYKGDQKLKKAVKSQLRFLIDPEIGMEKMLLTYGYSPCNEPRPNEENIPDGHFREDAHWKTAEWIYQYIKTWKPIRTPEELKSEKKATDPSHSIYNIEDITHG